VLSKIPCCKASQFWGVGVSGCNQGGRNPTDDLQHDMDKLGLDHVDLMLMHWGCDNMDDTVNVYKAMEKFMQAGKARAIGVSNFNGQMLEELVSRTTIKPAVNQVAFSVGNHAKESPGSTQDRQHWGSDDATLAKAKEIGTTMMAFSPLGGHGFYDVMHDATVKAVAAEKNVSTPQVGLRWLAQKGLVFVTSSNTPAHITSDFQIFDFDLSTDQMTRLSAVNRPDIQETFQQARHSDDQLARLQTAAHVTAQLSGIVPPGSLTHFCVVTGWDKWDAMVAQYAGFLGVSVPSAGIVGGIPANGTYLGKQLTGTTKIAFMDMNNMTRMEFLAGEPSQPSWWRDVYNKKGFEVHHMGYQLDEDLWAAVQRAEAAGLGKAMQWARWGNEHGADQPGAGCYVYIDSQATLGVTVELLANGPHCDRLPAPSSEMVVV